MIAESGELACFATAPSHTIVLRWWTAASKSADGALLAGATSVLGASRGRGRGFLAEKPVINLGASYVITKERLIGSLECSSGGELLGF